MLESMWCALARTSDLAEPGDYETFQLGRESVLVVRDRAGELRAYLNVCRHRGARLCTDEQGHFRRAIQCPYHAWTYDFDGHLIAAPNRAQLPDLDCIAHGLQALPSVAWLGYLWVCLADTPPSFEETVVAQVAERLGGSGEIERWEVDRLAVGRRVRYEVQANWKLIVENFMECYHCATIHPELVTVLPEFREGYAAQYYVGRGTMFGAEIAGFTVDGRPGHSRLATLDDDHDRRYYAITVRPQVFINLVPDHVIFHRMYPLAVDRTVVVCDWLFDPAVAASGEDIDASVELFHRVNTQDFEACERCQPSMSSRAYRDGGLLVPSEHHIGEFHSWVHEVIDDAALD